MSRRTPLAKLQRAITNLYRSYPAARADPLVGVVAFSESLANLSTGLSSSGVALALFVGDKSAASNTDMMARSESTTAIINSTKCD